ncbi:hypothetical protein C0J52_13431 [Blattella germanica]|nr:hypothetical protein C0J52_13431 [Blattella germanica]
MSYLAYLVAAIVCCAAAANIIRHNRGPQFTEHMNRVGTFRCSEPQPRAIRPEEIGLNISSDETVYPSMTVLSRCSCAGYCTKWDETCQAADSQQVELVFKVNNYVNNRFEYKKIMARNETLCSCQVSNQNK